MTLKGKVVNYKIINVIKLYEFGIKFIFIRDHMNFFFCKKFVEVNYTITRLYKWPSAAPTPAITASSSPQIRCPLSPFTFWRCRSSASSQPAGTRTHSSTSPRKSPWATTWRSSSLQILQPSFVVVEQPGRRAASAAGRLVASDCSNSHRCCSNCRWGGILNEPV